MNTKIAKKINFYLGIVAVGLAVGLSVQFVRAWTEPGAAPPGGNVGAPINTSGIRQIKAGELEIQSNLTLSALGNNSPRLQLIPSTSRYSYWDNALGTTRLVTKDTSGESAKLVIGNNGNVGIGTGTTAPGAKLDILGTSDVVLQLQRSGGTAPTVFKQGTDNALVINNNGIDSLFIKSAPSTTTSPVRIGIGTANPAEELEILSETDADLNLTTIDDSSDDGTGNNSVIHVRRACGTANNPMRIGSTCPSSDNSNTNLNGFEAEGWDTDGTGGHWIRAAGMAMSVDGAVSTNCVPGQITFYTRPAGSSCTNNSGGAPPVRMTIKNDGTVGIGTTSPQSTLQIGTPLNTVINYAQVDTLNANTAGPPPATDCDSAAEVGRMIVSTRYSATVEYRLWICTQTGAAAFAWKYTVLN